MGFRGRGGDLLLVVGEGFFFHVMIDKLEVHFVRANDTNKYQNIIGYLHLYNTHVRA